MSFLINNGRRPYCQYKREPCPRPFHFTSLGQWPNTNFDDNGQMLPVPHLFSFCRRAWRSLDICNTDRRLESLPARSIILQKKFREKGGKMLVGRPFKTFLCIATKQSRALQGGGIFRSSHLLTGGGGFCKATAGAVEATPGAWSSGSYSTR
jgi:hypothetical protein